MTSELCLQKAIEIAERNLNLLDEDTKESIIAYSSSSYRSDKAD